MSTPPAGISEADWETWPAGARELILSQHEEIELLRSQLTALANELACLRERIGRAAPATPPNLPPVTGLSLSSQSGARAVAASSVASRGIPVRGRNCRRCGTLLQGVGEDPDPIRQQVIEIPPITLPSVNYVGGRLPNCRRAPRRSNRW